MNPRLAYLLDRYCNQNSSDAETEELMEIIRLGEHDEEVQLFMDQSWQKLTGTYELSAGQSEKILSNVLKNNGNVVQMQRTPRKVFKWRMIAAAAILFLVSGLWFLVRQTSDVKRETVAIQSNDVPAPVSTKATITLANGQKIVLDSAANGTLATEANVNLVKTADGQIAYSGSTTEILYNTLVNPRGSKVVNITLADGTRVWLNAESSLKYPVAFVGKERIVEITGEAYFEVKAAHPNPARAGLSKTPFIVKKDNLEVVVLGTHFNVNAYDDEDVFKVTLLEGSVRVNQSTMLKPGQQAQINNSKEIKITNPKLDEVVAWRDGLFQFSDANIESIMRQAARWYDVEVSYEGKLNQNFSGKIPRTVTISELLKILESTGWVHFKIEGRKITVRP